MFESDFSEPPPVNGPPVKRRTAKLWLQGEPGTQSGTAIIQEGEQITTLKVPPAQYAVLFALAEKSLEDADLPPWRSRGYLTKKQLQERLAQFGVKSPWYSTKHVHRTRKTLSKIGQVGDLDGMAWAHEFLETSALNAYRLSLPPKSVFLDSHG